MGFMDQMSIGALFKDVQRMDKRQVSESHEFYCLLSVPFIPFSMETLIICKIFTAFIPIP